MEVLGTDGLQASASCRKLAAGGKNRMSSVASSTRKTFPSIDGVMVPVHTNSLSDVVVARLKADR